MKSILARLEALEARSPHNLILAVPMADGTEKIMGVKEFVEIPKAELSGSEFVRIISGNNLQQFDVLLDSIVGTYTDIIKKQGEKYGSILAERG